LQRINSQILSYMKKKTNPSYLLIFIVLALGIISCTKDPSEGGVASCEGCHTNYAHLQAVYTPDTAAPVGGCGGEAPHYEPYDRVFMGGAGYKLYKESSHYAIGCVGCHNGTDNTDDKKAAHSGDFIAHPSSSSDAKCASCHEKIVGNYHTSLHNGFGQKRKVTIRSGLNGPEDFDKLPQHQIEGYNSNCATCHGSCGNCHVVRPPIAGGGLANGHSFTKTPDMINTCVACHVSRGGHAYLGVASGTKPDVHLTKLGFTCLSCHDGAELHGDGKKVEQRYAYDQLPSCTECHNSIQNKNIYHSTHYTDINCQVCHSQDYNNCGSCHIHGDGARVPSYMGYKIAVNPLPTLKSYKFTLVRRTLAAPDNWEKFGVAQYANFDAFPTYNYASPHNLLRWTSRTQVTEGAACSANCHISNDGAGLKNTNLYLFKSDLLDWEKTATGSITVDGKLPSLWMK